MKLVFAAALLALAFTTGFTCSKNTPSAEQAPVATPPPPPEAAPAAPAGDATAAPAAPADGVATPAPGGETK